MPSAIPNLRPLTVGEILDASFKVYRRSFATMAKAILIVAVPFGIITGLVTAGLRSSTTDATTTIDPYTGQTQVNSHAVEKLFGLLGLDLIVVLIATSVATAVVYRVVGDAYLGHLPSWKDAVRGGLRKAHSVLWVTTLTALAFIVIVAVPAVLVIVLVAANVNGLAALLGVLTGIPALVTIIWFWVIAQLSVPSLMLENYKGVRAITRAGHLVRKQWWRSFGCLLLITLIVGILTEVVTGVLGGVLLSFAKSHLAVVAVEFLISLVTTVVFTPITACALMVLSIDLRVRKEGYDLHLLAQNLGTQPGSGALSFLPRPPVMWGGAGGWPQSGQGPYGAPQSPFGSPQTPHGSQAWSPPPPAGSNAWPPPPAGSPIPLPPSSPQSWPPPPAGSQAWPAPTAQPPQPAWSPPPAHPGQWNQPYAPGWGPPPSTPPNQQPGQWAPQGQPEPPSPPPLPFAPDNDDDPSDGSAGHGGS